MISTLFLLVNHMVRVILYNSLSLIWITYESEWTSGVGDGQGGLACCDSWGRKESDTTEQLTWSDLMFCKSGILIFIFAENNYNIYAHTMLIKTPFFHQSFDPHVLLSFSLSLSLRLFLWSAEVLWVQFPAWASKTLSRRHSGPLPHQQGAWGLREQSKLCARGFIGFLHKPRNISLFLSPLLSYWSTPDHQVKVH